MLLDLDAHVGHDGDHLGAQIAARAADQGKALADHFVHLTVHGMLHLLGYDHARTADAEMMEALEIAVLAGLGVADPYRSGRGGR